MTTKTVYPYAPGGAPLPPLALDASDLCPVAKACGEVKWLIPGSCLESPPPGPPEGKMTRAVDGEWVFVDAPPSEPTPEQQPEPSVSEIRERALDAMRAAREPMLNAVVGILTVAIADDDAATVAKAKEVRQALLDITHDAAFNAATTWEEMEAAAKLAYRRVAAMVASTPQFAAVFREVTGA